MNVTLRLKGAPTLKLRYLPGIVGALKDGDKGDIVVSGSGFTWTIAPKIFADQATAEAGANNTTLLSPLRGTQLLDARIGTVAGKLVALDGNAKIPTGMVADNSVATPGAVADGIKATKLAFLPSGEGAVYRTVGAKLGDTVHTADFNVLGAANQATALTSALAVATSQLVVGAGAYNLPSAVTLPANGAMLMQPGATIGGSGMVDSGGVGLGAAVDLSVTTGPRFISGGQRSAVEIIQVGVGSSPQPGLNVSIAERFTTGTGFYLGSVIFARKGAGATGHREALHVEQHSSSSTASEFVVGVHGYGRITAGSGNAFGLNGYAWVDAAADSTASGIGAELNTDIRRAVVTKAGLQIVDVATSTASGTTHDAGIIIGAQSGGVGYSVGVQFGFDATTGFGILSGGTLITAKATTQSLRAGLDLAGPNTWTEAPIVLRPNTRGVYWGATAAGGRVTSETTTNGGQVTLGSNVVVFRNGAGGEIGRMDPTHSYLMFWDGTNSYLRRCIVNAADSGGTGYRSIKVEN